jgi:hypothetical protein
VSKTSFINTADSNYGPQSTMKDIQGKWKMHGQTYRVQIYTTIQENSSKGTQTFGASFLSYSLPTMKTNVQSVHLESSCRCCSRQTSGTLLPFTTSDWGCLPRFHYKMLFQGCCKMRICRLGSIYGSRMMPFHHIFSCISEGLRA